MLPLSLLGWSPYNLAVSHIIFLAFNIFAISSQASKNIPCRNFLLLIALIPIPYIFYFSYKSIYNDLLLALVFTVTFFEISIQKNGPISLLFILSQLFILTLLKEVGFLLAIFCAFYYVILNLFKKNNIRNIILITFPIIISLVSWKIYVKQNNLRVITDTDNIINIFYDESSYIKFIGILKEFYYQFFNNQYINIKILSFSPSPAVILLILIIFTFLIILTSPKSIKLGKYIIDIIYAYSIFFTYILFILFCYFSFFSPQEAKNLASFNRYTSVIYIFLVYFLIFLTLRINYLRCKRVIIIISILIFLGFLSPFYKNKEYKRNGVPFAEMRLDFINLYNFLVKNEYNTSGKIYFLSQNTSSFEKLAFQYYIFPHLSSDNCWSLKEFKAENKNSYDCIFSPDLFNSYSYLYIHNSDEKSTNLLGINGFNKSIKGLYKIERRNNELIFKKIY
jgi:hypothetical protein